MTHLEVTALCLHYRGWRERAIYAIWNTLSLFNANCSGTFFPGRRCSAEGDGQRGRAVYVLYVVDLSGLGVGHLPAVGQRSERVLLRRMKVGVRLLGAVRDWWRGVVVIVRGSVLAVEVRPHGGVLVWFTWVSWGTQRNRAEDWHWLPPWASDSKYITFNWLYIYIYIYVCCPDPSLQHPASCHRVQCQAWGGGAISEPLPPGNQPLSSYGWSMPLTPSSTPGCLRSRAHK